MFNIGDCWVFDSKKSDTSDFKLKEPLFKYEKLYIICDLESGYEENNILLRCIDTSYEHWAVDKEFLLKHFHYCKTGKYLYE